MNKRPALGLIYTLEALKNQGLNIDTVLKNQGFKKGNIDSGANIAITKELAILSEVLELHPNDAAGIAMGATFSLSGYGAFGMLLISCKDTFDAINTGIQYQSLTYLYGNLSFEIGKKTSALCYHPSHLPDYLKQFIIDRDISGTFRLIEELKSFTNTNLSIKELWLPYSKPANLTAHQARYPFKLKFDQSDARFVFVNDDLHLPFHSASDTAYTLYKTQCDERIKSLSSDTDSLTEELRTHLSLFTNNYPNAEQVANTLGVSERSLRRKLSGEGNSFQSILDNCRFNKARQFLQQANYSIEDIAERLGYTESGSFIRAFQRWSGETPARFRKQHSS